MNIRHKHTKKESSASYQYWKEHILSKHVEENYEILSHPEIVDVYEIDSTTGNKNYIDTTDKNIAIERYLRKGDHYTLYETTAKFDNSYRIIVPPSNVLKSKINNSSMDKKDVFVTYSWDNEEHNDKVLSFTNFLRDNGFNAEVDKFHSQKETATDFYKMMHQAMTHYDKVIVVLSAGYKEKAENFKGGVGNEYSLILKDIETSTNKYILVTFGKIDDSITPLNFKGRQILELSDKRNINELFAKLKGEGLIEFSEVRDYKPEIQKKIIKEFIIEEKNIEIVGLDFKVDSTSQFAQLFTKIEYDLNLEIKNNTDNTFSDYSLEIYYPKNSTDYNVEGKIEGNYKKVTYDNNPKIFPQQSKSIKLEKFYIRHFTAEEILNSKILVKIFSEKGAIETEFNVQDVLYINTIYGKEKVNINKFQDKNYR